MEPAMMNWMVMQIKCMAMTTRNTFRGFQNCKGLSGDGHIREGTADVEWQQRDDDGVKYFVNDGREILHCVVQGISDLFPRMEEAQARTKARTTADSVSMTGWMEMVKYGDRKPLRWQQSDPARQRS